MKTFNIIIIAVISIFLASCTKEKLENKINEQKQMINEQTEDINFRKAFISKPLINTLYKLYCKKNHRDVK